MLQFKGSVQFVKDEMKDLPIKDKDGNPTASTKSHRILEIMMLIPQTDKTSRAIVVKGFDSKIKSPKVGDDWTTPEIRTYNAYSEACPIATIE